MWAWIFDGIGTEIVSVIIGIAVGGIVGYKVGVKNRGKQTQEAGDRSTQKQSISIDNTSHEVEKNKKVNSRETPRNYHLGFTD